MSRAHIALVAPPFAGHLHPLLGIGRALQACFDVRVFSSAAARAAIAAAELNGVTLLHGCDDAITAIANPPHRAGSNPLRLHAELRANLALMQRFRAELDAAFNTWQPDLVIADFTLPVAGVLARTRGIAWWTSVPSPCVLESRSGPPAYLGGWKQRDHRFGRVRDALGRAAVRAFKRGVGWLQRRELAALGIPSLYRADGSEAVYSDECILALGLEAFEYARDWPAALTFTDPVLYTPPYCGPAPQFRAGRRHVLVTLGTHLAWHKPQAIAAVRAAARTLPDIEIHFSLSDAGGQQHAHDDNYQELAYVSYQRDLPQYDLVVHHGGAGILYRCLSLGLPALVLPLDYDQFDHAARLESAGLARLLRRLEDFGPQIIVALDDCSLQTRCASARETITDACARIVETVAQHAIAATQSQRK